MAVKIRLRRTGRKRQPSFRIVVADESTPRDGEYLDSLGTYNPLTKPAELRIDLEKVDSWLAQGARMTDTAASLIRKARRGGDRKVALWPLHPEPRVETPAVAAAVEPTRSRAGSRGAPRAETPAESAAAADTASPTSAEIAAEATSGPAEPAE